MRDGDDYPTKFIQNVIRTSSTTKSICILLFRQLH
jgi:hypothetical protein